MCISLYHMCSTVDKSKPIENIHCLAHFVLWWYLSMLHTVTTQCIFSTLEHHSQGYNGCYMCAYGFYCVHEISLAAKTVLHLCLRHLCNTCLDNSWYFTVRGKIIAQDSLKYNTVCSAWDLWYVINKMHRKCRKCNFEVIENVWAIIETS